ncbi:MAG TPA: isoprenylcysteine carboxylmethyltransferase family protein, partial [Gemmatimonadales bacterium]|nr:isoprenylcysteine carboxylmethyltransferase family protein [Gemmatimonadales bacterium]
ERLVTDGPYRFTRNPMYLGFTLWYLAGTAWVNSLWLLVLLPVVLLVMQRGVITREEAYLERRFGREYTEYRARVRRWL